MNRSSSTSSRDEKPVTTVLWGCELNQEKRTWTFQPQVEGKLDCKLMLSTICLGEKAKEEMNLVEILPPAKEADKQQLPVTIASLQASILPMVAITGLELSPPITFQLRAGSGPVFLSGQECYDAADLPWEEEEEEEVEEEEEEDDDDEEEVSLEEESPVKQVKRLAPQKRTSVAKVGRGMRLAAWHATLQRCLRGTGHQKPGPGLPSRVCRMHQGRRLAPVLLGARLRKPWALRSVLARGPHPDSPSNSCFWFLEKKAGKRRRGGEIQS
ncbi:nucleoplasmin-2 isoform X2 [Choloepus didactylus]|uniref:nucleoplasmin-2 isoform X2 n=1 Tax=Choloepus didactylus TaxID=27675 RepID=UPI00189FAB3E|nr:nucleoplasmin-2 isoform X2 [Choloepus didactylus]